MHNNGKGHSSKRMTALLSKKAHRWLDVGCGSNVQEGYLGMDKRRLPGVEVVHDAEVLPWPFADRTFDRIMMSHLMEHLKPWLVIDIMDEMWRVLKVGGLLLLVMPYPGTYGHWQDPTHIKPWNEATPLYFTPGHTLYDIYHPKPWKVEANVWRAPGNLEIAMRKMAVGEKVPVKV